MGVVAFLVHSLDEEGTVWFSHFFENTGIPATGGGDAHDHHHHNTAHADTSFQSGGGGDNDADDGDDTGSVVSDSAASISNASALNTFSLRSGGISSSSSSRLKHPLRNISRLIADRVYADFSEQRRLETGKRKLLEGAFCLHDASISNETLVVVWTQFQR